MMPRVKAAMRYVRGGAAPWCWRIRKGDCPACAGRAFLAFDDTPFHTRCLSCAATLVNVSLIPVVQRHCGDFSGRTAYEMSSYGATFDFLRRHVRDLYCSEYFPGAPLGTVVRGIRNEDATQLTFADELFDVVTSNQVFEHVIDDRAAYRECARVLKRGGALIFSVPLYDTPRTEQIASIGAGGRIEWLGEPEYHDSRLAGPQSAPVFWRHSSNDIAARVASAGFARVELVDVRIVREQRIPQQIIYAVKGA
jgi:SAM-dependent methyltransferase